MASFLPVIMFFVIDRTMKISCIRGKKFYFCKVKEKFSRRPICSLGRRDFAVYSS